MTTDVLERTDVSETNPVEPQLEYDPPILAQFGNDSLQRCLVPREGLETNLHDHEPVDRDDPTVTYLHIPPSYTFDASSPIGSDGEEALPPHAALALHLQRNRLVTRLPNHEALLVPTNPYGGMWDHHAQDAPKWVASNDEDYARILGGFYNCDYYDLNDESFQRFKEDSHHTLHGPPGVGPQAGPLAPRALKVNAGNDIQAQLLGGNIVDFTGIATASGATSLTATGTPFVASAYVGCRVYASVSTSQMVWGFITANTTSVLTVDRWNTVGTPGGAAGSNPSATAVFVIMGAGGPAAWFMGLTATATAPSATDTALTGEVTAQPAGLVRKICPYAHSAGVNTYTLTPVFTIGGGDTSLPITVAQMACFNTMVVATTVAAMLFRTLLNATATLTASGDQLTVTETVTM